MLFTFSFLPGLLVASWVTHIPVTRDILSISTTGMGAVLFGLSIGSTSGILYSTWLIKQLGTHRVIHTTMSYAVLGIAILSVALWLHPAWLSALGLSVFGASFGTAEVAINVGGAAVEREMSKIVLPMTHGFYSLGALVEAGVGMVLAAFSVPATAHILPAAVVVITPTFIAIKTTPSSTGKSTVDDPHSGEKRSPFYHDIQLLPISVVMLTMVFAEGSINNWFPLLMVDRHGFSPISGLLVYAGFTLGAIAGRLIGGQLIDRYSHVAVAHASALMSTLGISLITSVDNSWMAGVSVILWGLGVSPGFPLTISAANDIGPDTPTRVSVAATTGCLVFLVGPLLLGYPGEYYGLCSATPVVLALALVAAVVAKAVAKPDLRNTAATENS